MTDETPINFDRDTVDLLARISYDRAQMWRLLRDLLTVDRAVDSTTFPSWLVDVQESIAWIGDEAPLFEPALELAQTFQLQAGRTASAEADAHSKNAAFQKFYTEQWRWAFVQQPLGERRREDVERFASTMEDLCRREWAAWEVGDETGGQFVRAEELQRLEAGAGELVRSAAVPLISAGSSMIGKLVGEYVLAVLTLESGRDYQAAAYEQK